MKDKATDVAGSAVETLKERTGGLQSTAKDKLATKADDSRTQAVDKAREVETQLRDFTDTVREQQPQIADTLESVIDRARPLVDYVENTSIDQMVSEAQRQVRQRPWIAAAGMFAIGFALSRALKPVGGVIDSVTGGNEPATPQIPMGGTSTPSQLPQRTGAGSSLDGALPQPAGAPSAF
jgi:ElaB/YqjD/DUF883 family membrane-anchored ribosome-binding protein